jgi:antitoxin (DNA-binding transcriptional repressor) of toxin-antitoxin stability system
MSQAKTISATEFKATCLDLLDRLSAVEWELVGVTKRGKVVAVLTAPTPRAPPMINLHGFVRNNVTGPALFQPEPNVG